MNSYRNVGNRVAVELSSFQLPFSPEQMLDILARKSFVVETPDIVGMLWGVVGKPTYRRGAKLSEAPEQFDCSSLTRWTYAALGVWLPRRTIQQLQIGDPVSEPSDLRTGDLLFTKGRINYWLPGQETHQVGHVGIFVEANMVIHATSKANTVEATPFEEFTERFRLEGVRRPANLGHITTLSWDDDREVETSDDVYWTLFREVQ